MKSYELEIKMQKITMTKILVDGYKELNGEGLLHLIIGENDYSQENIEECIIDCKLNNDLMGIEICNLIQGLSEQEIDYIFLGIVEYGSEIHKKVK